MPARLRWIPEAAGKLDIETRAGPISVNRYVVANRNERAVVLYWYQTPQRAIASEWTSKFWVLADAIRHKSNGHRAGPGLVWSAPGGDQLQRTRPSALPRVLSDLAGSSYRVNYRTFLWKFFARPD